MSRVGSSCYHLQVTCMILVLPPPCYVYRILVAILTSLSRVGSSCYTHLLVTCRILVLPPPCHVYRILVAILTSLSRVGSSCYTHLLVTCRILVLPTSRPRALNPPPFSPQYKNIVRNTKPRPIAAVLRNKVIEKTGFLAVEFFFNFRSNTAFLRLLLQLQLGLETS
jgi:hypothetical protein